MSILLFREGNSQSEWAMRQHPNRQETTKFLQGNLLEDAQVHMKPQLVHIDEATALSGKPRVLGVLRLQSKCEALAVYPHCLLV